MSIEERLITILQEHRYLERQGAFFGGVSGRPIGSGMILRNCVLPFFDEPQGKFLTARGVVYVLTHECDIDPGNQRLFNDKLLIAPIIDFRIWFDLVSRELGESTAHNVARGIVRDEIFRVFYLPTIPNSSMDFGGFLYLNEISNIPATELDSNVTPLCTLTDYSFRLLEIKILNHLFRPKEIDFMRIH